MRADLSGRYGAVLEIFSSDNKTIIGAYFESQFCSLRRYIEQVEPIYSFI